MPRKIVTILNDLIFTVKIGDAARRAGLGAEFVTEVEDAVERVNAETAAVILDLNFAPLDAIPRLKETGVRLIGFVAHVQVDVMRQAKELGCDEVMPRSAFVVRLAGMMHDLAAPAPAES